MAEENGPKVEATLRDVYLGLLDVGLAYMALSNVVTRVLSQDEFATTAADRYALKDKVDLNFKSVSATLKQLLDLGCPE